ncbi:glycosyltransferase family 4 protein [Metabacillus arenae]|uniref:Undecaprenyl/decaprenyl-phosphate alpha-N-acetylglucosaminyl 1-phosphate transferase n=1 Tax=Metabacillus arenae TaxID=2771434 RepID=A0A926NKG7_9BACI|nr:MraY family glycosyltransferase [Metabacillus arenae]MBD1383006.1 undecaprenyl/decaprenyl-phosphate alpha-N-acetylglucosaminyl 1-phosphate transferase [Metabacillus arenae]
MDIRVVLAFIASFITVLVVTPLVMKIAIKIGAIDKPNVRKVHQKVMPTLGGLAIFIGVAVGYFASGLYENKMTGIIAGALIIIITGMLDDFMELSAKVKLLVQTAAAIIVVSTGMTIEFLNIPFLSVIDLGLWAYPVTVLWIVGITNAINLIDGLDGLAAGISAIIIGTIAVMAGLLGKSLILSLAVILLASTLAFLFYNFHPAKIFMGDTGALFLGYSISILSLLGLYKSVTLFSFVVPIIILGVPIFDTLCAIIRRIVNKKPISAPDKSHLHHRLMAIGLSHRKTVLVIYAFGTLFSISAVIFESTTLWGSLLILLALILIADLIAETVGLVSENHRPLLKFYKKVFGKQ